MQPILVDVQAMGQLEGYTHQASFIFLHDQADMKLFCDEVYDFLMSKNEIAFGVSVTHCNGLLVRILGYKAEQLYTYLKNIASLIQEKKELLAS